MIESISNFLPLGCAPHLVTALETDYEYPMICIYIYIDKNCDIVRLQPTL